MPIILFALILFSSLLQASEVETTIKLDRGTIELNPETQLRYIEDSSGTLEAKEASSLASSAWQALPDGVANFSFSSSHYWFKLDIANIDSIDLHYYLHINYALLDQISLYEIHVDKNNTLLYQVGDIYPFNQRPVSFPTFLLPIDLKAGESKQYLIRVASEGSVQVPITIQQRESFLLTSTQALFLYGCFLSALLIMGAYNFCLYIIIRDKSYLLYSLFIVCMAGVHGSLDGYAYQWFWPDATQWHQISAIMFIGLGLVSTVLFTRALLPIPKQSKLNTGTKLLTILAIGSALATIFIPYRPAAILSAVMTVIVMGSVAITCIAMLWHSPRIARFFCVAWGAYFLGIVLKSTSKLGYVPYSPVTEYAGNIGAVIGIVVIAMALADRINTERRARENAQAQSISNLRRFEDLYKNALEGIFTYDLQGRLLEANPAFLKLLGLKDAASYSNCKSELDGFHLSKEQFATLFKKIKEQGNVVDYEVQMHDPHNASLWVNISARLVTNDQETLIEGTLININERKAFEEQLKHLAEHDPLTGFYNRRAFENSAKELLDKVLKHEETACLMYMDLDQFKIVNDLCGHTAGDLLLKNISQKLQQEVNNLSGNQLIARLGGDEFGILLSGTGLPKARLIAESLRASVEQFLFVWEGKRYSIGVSIGLVEICPFHQSVEQLLVMADTACYMAKDQGRNRVHVFVETDKDMQFRQLEMQWVSNIKEALSQDQFFLVFQNIAPNQNNEKGYHYEILLRLMNSQGNLSSPGQFLPAAERYNLMPNIDRWVIKSYFAWLNQHPDHLTKLSCASINLSTQSIGHEDFPAFLIKIFDEYKIPPSKICFEITESMAITHLDNTQNFIAKFRSLGCRFALDDFGTGFSSYAYLKDLNIDYLKIDGVFIQNLCEDSVNTAMVKSIADIASAIGIETIAEFVESQKIQEKLSEIGITYSQGYHIHKPVKLEHLAFKHSNNNQHDIHNET